MEVHHHSHTARKKFLHYFWEFFMLFMAVTLGFFVENQREHYIEHQRAKVYATQLMREVKMDRDQIYSAIGRIKLKAVIIDSQLHYVSQNDWKSIYRDINSIDVFAFITFHKASLEQIKNSGSLRYFNDKELVTALQEYINLQDDIEFVQSDLINYYNQNLTPFIQKNFDKSITVTNNTFISFAAQFDSLWNNSTKPSEFLSGQSSARVEYKNHMLYIRDSYSLDQRYAELNHSADKLISLLEKEYYLN